ncbi:hypothetical protein GGF31_007144 [Allomyces arbusculus]|nr:hypothetical protein GGF31_007144 [Allomyces arbusculus]
MTESTSAHSIYQQSPNLQAAAASQGIQVRALADIPYTLRIISKTGADVEIKLAKKLMGSRCEWHSGNNDSSDTFASIDDNWDEDAVIVENKTLRPISVHVTSANSTTDPNGGWFQADPGT